LKAKDNHAESTENRAKYKIVWLLADTIRAAVPTSRNVSQKILWLGSKKS